MRADFQRKSKPGMRRQPRPPQTKISLDFHANSTNEVPLYPTQQTREKWQTDENKTPLVRTRQTAANPKPENVSPLPRTCPFGPRLGAGHHAPGLQLQVALQLRAVPQGILPSPCHPTRGGGRWGLGGWGWGGWEGQGVWGVQGKQHET